MVETDFSSAIAKLEAARDLLTSTKRTLQLLDIEILSLSAGRGAIEVDSDVSSEHRVSWLGVTDDTDHEPGIIFLGTPAPGVGWGNPLSGTVRNQEDAAFVCTNILVARELAVSGQDPDVPVGFMEGFDCNSENTANLHLRFTDMNTGRNLVSGFTTGPTDLDRGAVPLSYISSSRYGMGTAVKNKLFAEFTIPRAGAVRVELFNLAASPGDSTEQRLFLALFGYKAFGA